MKSRESGATPDDVRESARFGYRMPVSPNGGTKRSTLCEARGLRTFGIYHGEFDPGSERTLAACLKHASRAARGSNTP